MKKILSSTVKINKKKSNWSYLNDDVNWSIVNNEMIYSNSQIGRYQIYIHNQYTSAVCVCFCNIYKKQTVSNRYSLYKSLEL